MNIVKSDIPEVLILEPGVFEDERGFFLESYNEREFSQKTGITPRFVQDGHSKSIRNVLRGLHYQVRQPQGKLIRVTAGEVFDVAVDLRKNSPSLGLWTAHILSDRNQRMLWLPPGFAHGFLVTSDYAEVQYKATDYWAPQFERCIAWDDRRLNIPWPLQGEPLLSAKDRQGVPFDQAETVL